MNLQDPEKRVRDDASAAARSLIDWASSVTAGVVAAILVLAWLVTGSFVGFTQQWFALLFAISSATMFVLVFLVQHATGRDLRAALLKLDELIAATDGASDDLKRAERGPLAAQGQLEVRRRAGLWPGVAGSAAPEPGNGANPRQGELPVVDDFDELVRLVTDRPDLFLRYSKGPAVDAGNGPSRDYEAGVEMPGLSVTTIGPDIWWPRPVADWVCRRICKYAELGEQQDRFPWLLTGRVVGHGPDHEPLVVDVEPVARIGRTALTEAGRRYRERFDVGQDSRG